MTVEEVKTMLQEIITLIKERFPEVKVGSVFATPSINESLEIPCNLDVVGFDYFYSLLPEPRNMQEFFDNYLAYLKILKSKMYPHQKLVLVPGAAHLEGKPIPVSESKEITDFYSELAKADPQVQMIIAFLYPSIPGIVGLADSSPEDSELYGEMFDALKLLVEIIPFSSFKAMDCDYCHSGW